MPPPLSETFTSPINGISIAYPSGWRTKPATRAVDDDRLARLRRADRRLHLRPIAEGPSVHRPGIPAAGRQDRRPMGGRHPRRGRLRSYRASHDRRRHGPRRGDCNMAAVALDGRGYFVVLYTSGDEPCSNDVYDRAWFEQLLTTIDLRPEDAASAAPSSRGAVHAAAIDGDVHVVHERDLALVPSRLDDANRHGAVDETAWPAFGSGRRPPVRPLTEHPPVHPPGLPAVGRQDRRQWAADTLGAEECARTVPVTIDGASGLAGVECNVAAVGIDGRGYFVMFYTSETIRGSARCTTGPGSSSS